MSIDTRLGNIVALLQLDNYKVDLSLIWEGKAILQNKISLEASIAKSLEEFRLDGTIPAEPSEKPILKNKFGIDNPEHLKKVETVLLLKRLTGLETAVFQDIGFDTMSAIHTYLYGDIFEFAGVLRSSNPGRDPEKFCDYKSVGSATKVLCNKIASTNARLSLDKLTALYAFYLMELEYLSPFRLGNRLTINKYLAVAAKSMRMQYDLFKVDTNGYFEARKQAQETASVQPYFDILSSVLSSPQIIQR